MSPSLDFGVPLTGIDFVTLRYVAPCVAAILLCSDLSCFLSALIVILITFLCLCVRLNAVYRVVQLAKQTLIALTSYMQL